MAGKDDTRVLRSHRNETRKVSIIQEGSIARKYFPFKQGYLSVATLRVGSEGIQMTVDGKHVTSFAIREVFSPSLYLFSHIFHLNKTFDNKLAYILLRPWSHGLLVKYGYQGT